MSKYWYTRADEEAEAAAEKAARNSPPRPSPYPSSPRHFRPFSPNSSILTGPVYGPAPPPRSPPPSKSPFPHPWPAVEAAYQAALLSYHSPAAAPPALAQGYEQSGDEGQGAEVEQEEEEEEETPRSPSLARPPTPTPAPRASRPRRPRAPRAPRPRAPRPDAAAAAAAATVPAAVPAVAPAAFSAANPANAANTGPRPQLPPGFRYEGNFVLGHRFQERVVVPEGHGQTQRNTEGENGRAPRGELNYCATCTQWVWRPCFGRNGGTQSMCNHCSRRRWRRDNLRKNVEVPDHVWLVANQPDVLHIKRNEPAYRP